MLFVTESFTCVGGERGSYIVPEEDSNGRHLDKVKIVL